jgi:hypothetical protein
MILIPVSDISSPFAQHFFDDRRAQHSDEQQQAREMADGE